MEALRSGRGEETREWAQGEEGARGRALARVAFANAGGSRLFSRSLALSKTGSVHVCLLVCLRACVCVSVCVRARAGTHTRTPAAPLPSPLTGSEPQEEERGAQPPAPPRPADHDPSAGRRKGHTHTHTRARGGRGARSLARSVGRAQRQRQRRRRRDPAPFLAFPPSDPALPANGLLLAPRLLGLARPGISGQPAAPLGCPCCKAETSPSKGARNSGGQAGGVAKGDHGLFEASCHVLGVGQEYNLCGPELRGARQGDEEHPSCRATVFPQAVLRLRQGRLPHCPAVLLPQAPPRGGIRGGDWEESPGGPPGGCHGTRGGLRPLLGHDSQGCPRGVQGQRPAVDFGQRVQHLLSGQRLRPQGESPRPPPAEDLAEGERGAAARGTHVGHGLLHPLPHQLHQWDRHLGRRGRHTDRQPQRGLCRPREGRNRSGHRRAAQHALPSRTAEISTLRGLFPGRGHSLGHSGWNMGGTQPSFFPKGLDFSSGGPVQKAGPPAIILIFLSSHQLPREGCDLLGIRTRGQLLVS